MSGFGRGRTVAGRPVERDGPFGPVRSCPLFPQRPHPSNLREAKAQGRMAPAGKDERRWTPIADGSSDRNPEAEPTHPRSTDPSGARFVALPIHPCRSRRGPNEEDTAPNRFNRAGRSHGKTTVTGEPTNGTWVRACGNTASARMRDQTCEGTIGTPGAPSGERRRKRHRHTRDIRPTCGSATFTGRKHQ